MLAATLKLLVTGAHGQLGSEITRLVEGDPTVDLVALSSAELDVVDRRAVFAAVSACSADLIIHAAAWTAVDACEGDAQRAFRVNALGSRNVAEAARRCGAHLVAISTDYVFDGTGLCPYNEWDTTNPLSVYGSSKRAGEQEVLSGCPSATIVRTSWVCGAFGVNMVKTVLRLASGDAPLRFVDDQVGCPTFTSDLAPMLLRLGEERVPGVIHVTNQGPTSWYQFACDVISASGGDPERVEAVATDDLFPARPAPRPRNSVLDNAVLRFYGFDLLADYHDPLIRTVTALTS